MLVFLSLSEATKAVALTPLFHLQGTALPRPGFQAESNHFPQLFAAYTAVTLDRPHHLTPTETTPQTREQPIFAIGFTFGVQGLFLHGVDDFVIFGLFCLIL
jgi:hypothetical protein